MSLQEWVKELRKKHGCSQGELAERVAADPAPISRYENGRITPSADVVVKPAEVFDVSTDYLLVWSGTAPAGCSGWPRTPWATAWPPWPSSAQQRGPHAAAASSIRFPRDQEPPPGPRWRG